MDKIRVFPLAGLVSLLLVFSFVGCDSDPSGIPMESATDDDYDDVAEDFAVTLADPDEGMLNYWFETTGGGQPVNIKPNGSRALLDTVIERGGITITIDRTFFDVDDNPSEEYDSATTVRMTRDLTIEGERNGEYRQATIDHHGFIEINNIAPDDEIHTLNGNGTREVSSQFQARWRLVSREFEAIHSWEEVDVELSADRVLNPYPLSGHVIGESDITRTSTRNENTRTVEVHVEFTVTFDGTQYAQVEIVDGPTYWIDLETGEVYRERPE